MREPTYVAMTNTPMINQQSSLSSLESNDSPHQDVVSKLSFRKSKSNIMRHSISASTVTPATARTSRRSTATSLRESERTFVVKKVSSDTSGTSSDSGNHANPILIRDMEDREEPIYLDEISQILLEGIHQDVYKKIIKALGRLADISSQNQEKCNQACQMGAPAAIVAAMKKWAINKNIQAACFRVLIALTVGEECLKVRKTIWMVGGMEQILDAMGQFPESRSIQFFGCNALLSLLPSGCEDENKKIKKWMGRRFVREFKGVKAVIASMIQFEEDRGIQEAGCSVLLKLATFMHSGQDRKLLLESGAVSAFSIALESHASDEAIQHYTTLFMNFMSGDL